MLVLAGIVEISAKTSARFHPVEMIVVTRVSCFCKPKVNIWAAGRKTVVILNEGMTLFT